jgi:hypothetical protein
MNSILKCTGLSARRKTSEDQKRQFSIYIKLLQRGLFLGTVAALFSLLSSCDKNTKERNPAGKSPDHALSSNDSQAKPQVNIKVDRHYDEKGNLIGFDSTYSSFYSNMKGDTLKMDSLMHNFDRYFDRNHSSFFDRQFNTLFFNDSTRYPDFFHDDYFLKRYELNDEYMRGMMREMDSIKNNFFKRHRYTSKGI